MRRRVSGGVLAPLLGMAIAVSTASPALAHIDVTISQARAGAKNTRTAPVVGSIPAAVPTAASSSPSVAASSAGGVLPIGGVAVPQAEPAGDPHDAMLTWWIGGLLLFTVLGTGAVVAASRRRR